MARSRESTEVDTPADDGDIDPRNLEAAGIGDTVPESWDDVAAQFDGEIVTFEGSPWKVVEKKSLVGIPFMIADVRFYEGTYGPAVAVCGLTQDGERFVFNDGSTGIYSQMVHMVRTSKRKGGIICNGGLRVSHYTYEDPFSKEKKPAETYYVA